MGSSGRYNSYNYYYFFYNVEKKLTYMVVTLIIYIIGLLINTINSLLPDWQVWPDEVFESINWFFNTLMELSSIIFFMPILLDAILFLLNFIAYYCLYKIIIKVVNLMRGANGID